MRRILLFILPILIIVAIVFTVFGIFQVRFTQERLMDDLKRKAKSVDERLEFSVKNIFINNDLKSANRLVESFQKKERLQGCVLYDKEGQIIAITERISDWKQKDKPCIKDILETKNPRESLEKFNDAALFFDAKEGDFAAKYEALIKDADLRSKLSRKASIIANTFLGSNRLKEDLRRLLCG